MIKILIAFISGFLLCLALCWKRLRESQQALEAACELAEMRSVREMRYQETLSKLRATAELMPSNRYVDLGGSVELPAPTNRTGQHFSIPFNRVTAGLTVNGGPDFSQGDNNGDSVS